MYGVPGRYFLGGLSNRDLITRQDLMITILSHILSPFKFFLSFRVWEGGKRVASIEPFD
jgi:hypothetical protein